MHRLHGHNQVKLGRAIRVSHGKVRGAAVGEVEVLDGLPNPLRQGLFAEHGRYPVIVRLANVPRARSALTRSRPSGLSIKVLGVNGEMLPGHAGETTRICARQRQSLRRRGCEAVPDDHLMLEHAPQIADPIKAAMSAFCRSINKVTRNNTVRQRDARLLRPSRISDAEGQT